MAAVRSTLHHRKNLGKEFVELFVQEAKTLVSLSHANLVPLYELGMHAGTYFIAMEYIDGPTLAQLQQAAHRRGEALRPAMAAHIAAEVLKGLDYAHRKGAGVIHRDLSPHNIMLSRDGEIKILDFGIAATVGDAALMGRAGERPAGSFPYMSPEQVRGELIGPASDLFSAGILLWEMLTGEPLFARADPDATSIRNCAPRARARWGTRGCCGGFWPGSRTCCDRRPPSQIAPMHLV